MSRRLRPGVAAVGLVLVLAACGSTSGTEPVSTATVPPSAPLTTTLDTPGATWVVVPMGQLDDPNNTFWQLFVRSRAGGSWKLVTPPGVADNGGLVVTWSGQRSLVVGFRPSQDLRFSPLAITLDQGDSYQPDLLTAGLASVPDALSVSANGDAAAVVDGGASVLTRARAGSDWTQLATAASIGNTSVGRACGLAGLTSVAQVGSTLYLGASCDQPGVVGIMERSASAVRLVPVHLPGSLASDRVQVLRLQATAAGVAALVQLTAGGQSAYAAVWSDPAGRSWEVSPTLPAAGELLATGTTAQGGFTLLTRTSTDGRHAAVIEPGRSAWTPLPDPPSSTAALAVSAQSTDALVVESTRFVDDRLDPSGHQWHARQTITVDIPLGSSG